MKTAKGRLIKAEGLRFGPQIISDFAGSRCAAGLIWAEGYTQNELDCAQEKFGLTFPPDLITLFLQRRPVRGWDWRSDERQIREMLEWPLKGLLFDVEMSGLWWPEWGGRPAEVDKRAEILRAVVRQAPKLVPLISHRYIPCEPCEVGNPVYSIYQSDVIYYGANLTDYFEHEHGNSAPTEKPTKHIRFWSDLVERAFQRPFYPARTAD